MSDDARRLAEKYLHGAYRVLPNAVEIDRFAKAEPWPTDERAIFFIGRHEERKGLAVLLDAFADLDRDAVLWVGGEGPQTDELRARGIPRVEWLGRISDVERARRLRAASLFCAPSLHGESFGIVLLEAMAAGAPVVASEIAGYRDVARANREALLVEPGNGTALRDALRAVLDGSACTREITEAATARAGDFSMDGLAERFESLYEQAIAAHPR